MGPFDAVNFILSTLIISSVGGDPGSNVAGDLIQVISIKEEEITNYKCHIALVSLTDWHIMIKKTLPLYNKLHLNGYNFAANCCYYRLMTSYIYLITYMHLPSDGRENILTSRIKYLYFALGVVAESSKVLIQVPWPIMV